tara:strand:+ start:22430 stop:23296 length:867 start_codon:yes stop_codon:yes gene_type:complete
MPRKGIVLAGGMGTRMYPLTVAVSKQLLPLYDKPMIYYPLSILMKAGIKDIIIISSKEHLPLFKKLLGTGSELGLNLIYKVQNKPQGIAQSILLAKDFLKKSDFCLVLGDNIIFGDEKEILNKIRKANVSKKATIFTKKVSTPELYGVAKFNKNLLSLIVEKPKEYISNQAVIGLYFFPNAAIQETKKLKFSERGELEITDLNNILINQKKMGIIKFSNNIKWYDAGSHKDYYLVINKIHNIQKKTNSSIACLHEIAYKSNFINRNEYKKSIIKYEKSFYGDYLKSKL